MIILFWTLTIILSLLGLAVILPGLTNRTQKRFFTVFFLAFIYIFYLSMGESKRLPEYYSEAQINARIMQDKMRPLFSEMKKQQGRLRLKILEDQNDILSKALLLELLGVEALYHEERRAAVSYWDAALALLEEAKETKTPKDKNSKKPEKQEKSENGEKEKQIEIIMLRIQDLKTKINLSSKDQDQDFYIA